MLIHPLCVVWHWQYCGNMWLWPWPGVCDLGFGDRGLGLDALVALLTSPLIRTSRAHCVIGVGLSVSK